MDIVKQSLFVIAMNVRALRFRLGTSAVIVIGIAGVVAVLISVLAMAAGLLKTLHSSAREDRVVVVRNGASDETSSILSREAAITVLDAPQVKRDAAGKPVGSAEAIVVASLAVLGDNSQAQVSIRGVGPNAELLRPEIRIVQGRLFQPGVNELIVGIQAAKRFQNVKVGDHPLVGGKRWTVVGIFESRSAHDSSFMTDAETLMNMFAKNEYQSITVQLQSAAAIQAFRDALRTSASLPVEVISERDFFERQSKTLSKVLKIIAYVVGGIMAFGAIFAALNIMYSAVSARAVQIATLRAIGYGPDAMVIAVLVETFVLALIGGAVGAALSWFAFNGYHLSTISGSGAQLVFELAVTPQIALVGIAWASAIGFVGGLLPALQAARLPVVVAMRSA